MEFIYLLWWTGKVVGAPSETRELFPCSIAVHLGAES